MKLIKKTVITLLIIFSITLIVPYISIPNNISTVEAAKVKLSKKKAVLIKRQTLQLKLSGTTSKPKWSSNRKSIASVNKNGKVTAKKKGTAIITAKINKKSYRCKIIVETPKLSQTTALLKTGETLKLTLNGTVQKVKWESTNSFIASVSNKGIIKAKKAGTVTIIATVNKKKYVCKIVVNKSNASKGSRTNPLSAYDSYTTSIYVKNEYVGEFNIQLLDFKHGTDAYNIVKKNEDNLPLSSNKEYIYTKFKITYKAGVEEVLAFDIIDSYNNFFNSNANYQLSCLNEVNEFDTIPDAYEISLYPGGSAIFSCATIIRSGHTPITYRIETGFDEETYKPIYTWFTTKK